MKKQISTEQTEANIKEVLRLLTETPGQLERLSRGLSESKLREPLGRGERSFIEVMAHISELRGADIRSDHAGVACEGTAVHAHPS